MNTRNEGTLSTIPRLPRAILAPLLAAVGLLAATLSLALITGWATGQFDYQQPNACAAGECLSARASSTGHCEEWPAVADRLSGLPGFLWMLGRIAGIGLALGGMLLAWFNFLLAWNCFKPAPTGPRKLSSVPFAVFLIPLAALVLPLLAAWSLKPGPFFSI